jgi:phosphate transport system protein
VATDAPTEPPIETRRSFHHQLDAIAEDIVRLCAMVGEFIGRGTEVLLTLDLKAAQALIEDDDEVDALTIDIEERCYQMLALQQPMAGDLRAIVTALRITSEIERSGDLMVNVAKGARRIYGMDAEPRLRGLVQRMSDEALRLLHIAVDAYVEKDDAKAAALDDMDDRLDAIHTEYIAQVLEACRAGNVDVQTAVQLALIGRYYERIGDHAVNMGERVRYMVTGWLPEHVGAARAAQRADRE